MPVAIAQMTEFDEIRPFRDAEVPTVVRRMIADPEFVDLLLERQFPVLVRYCSALMRPLLRWRLRYLSRNIRTVRDLQMIISERLVALLDRTTDGYSFSGIDTLDPSKAYVFMSNHRDIALDPAMVILGLVKAGRESLRIAIGDNLLSKPFASDLIRINRSFIVKRSVTGRREKLGALKLLSRYIRQSIGTERVSVWIAQAEGRAKDGRDRTETALLKMLAFSRDSDQSFGAAMAELNIVPVSIAYEFDPCDGDKARELHAAQQGETYVKGAYEDLDTIKKGFVGYKGRVHITFGALLTGKHGLPDELAGEIDRQIFSGYRLFPSNICAWRLINADADTAGLTQLWPNEDWAAAGEKFNQRIAQLPAEHRDIVIQSYAAPVVDQLSDARCRGQFNC